MSCATILMHRLTLAACQQLAIPARLHRLTFLYPSLSMSRRSSRLSSTLNDSLSMSNKHHSTDAAAGPPSLTSQERAIPYFEEWPTEALQAEVKRYGFKVSRKRSTLIDQLKAVYEALDRSKAVYEAPVSHEKVADLEVDAGTKTKRKLVLPTSTAVAAKGKGKGRKSDPFVLEEEESDSSESIILAPNGSEAGDYTAQLEAEALSATDGSESDIPLSASTSLQTRRGRPRGSRSSSSSSSEIPLSTLTEQAVEPTPALAETMTTAIRSDAGVWGRILRYEPISFDEFVSIVTTSGLGMDTGKRKEELKTWLDRQCICFYSNDLTGPRSRH